MQEEIVRQFPSIRVWAVGFEPDLTFYDCQGRQLELGALAEFAVDLLGGSKQTLNQFWPERKLLALTFSAARAFQ